MSSLKQTWLKSVLKRFMKLRQNFWKPTLLLYKNKSLLTLREFFIHHKTFKTMQNLTINRIATPQLCRRWKGAGWRLSNEKRFCGF